jgi:hypothetical protein
LVLEHDHTHESRATSKAPSIPISLYFSYVFIVHKANVKRIRSWNIQGKKAGGESVPDFMR